MRMQSRFLPVIFLMMLMLGACAAPTTPGLFPEDTSALYTQAAQTVIAQMTSEAPLSILPTETVVFAVTPTTMPTDTPEPSPTVPEPTSTPEPSATPVSSATPEVLFQDDFSKGTGWFTEQSDDFSFEYADEGYRMTVNLLGAAFWSVRKPEMGDLRLEVDATWEAGPVDGYYGLVCRHQDEDNYYALVISSNGQYGIIRMLDGELKFLDEGTASETVIHRGNIPNHIRADCVGQTLTLYANDQKLLEVQDDSFATGLFGLIAGTRLSGKGLEVLVDNFELLKP